MTGLQLLVSRFVTHLQERGHPRRIMCVAHHLKNQYICCISYILVAILNQYSINDKMQFCFRNLVRTMNAIQSFGCWWPASRINGLVGSKYHVFSIHHKLKNCASKAAGRYPPQASEFRSKDGVLGSILDKPYLHGMLELFHHRVWLYGHTLIVSEMALESHRQFLKAGLNISMHVDVHIPSAERILARDWQRLVIDLIGTIRPDEGR